MHGQGSVCNVALGLMRGGGVGPCLRPANQTQEEPGQAVLEQGQQHPDIVALGQ